jgi:hypothetical protein
MLAAVQRMIVGRRADSITIYSQCTPPLSNHVQDPEVSTSHNRSFFVQYCGRGH